MKKNLLKKIWREPSRGASAVEFSLMLLWLVPLMFGIVETSIALYDKAVITNASREAARAGVVMSKDRMLDEEIRQVALNYCANYLTSFSGMKASPSVNVQRPASPAQGDLLTVTVTYPYTAIVLGRLYEAWKGPIQLSATTAMAYE
jgi:Flp pilus assembly protein TadG